MDLEIFNEPNLRFSLVYTFTAQCKTMFYHSDDEHIIK